MDLEYKSAVTGVKVLDEGEGIVQAIVSVTNIVDSVNDQILPGAYRDTLTKRTPKGLRGHDWNRMVAKTLHAEELMPGDPRIDEISPRIARQGGGGLLIRGKYNLNTQAGRDAYEDAKFFGDEMEFSVGYKVPKGMSAIVPKSGVRQIKQMDLYEWSDVAFGAAPLTAGTASVKSAIVSMIEAGELSEEEILEWTDLLHEEKWASLSDEEKARRVRTREGARRFGQPIGSAIRGGQLGPAIRTPRTTGPNRPTGHRSPARARPRPALFDQDRAETRTHRLPSGLAVTVHTYPDLDYGSLRHDIEKAGGLKGIAVDANQLATLLVRWLIRSDNVNAIKADPGWDDEDWDEDTLVAGVAAEIEAAKAEAGGDLRDADLEWIVDRAIHAMGLEGKADVVDLLEKAAEQLEAWDALELDGDDEDVEEKARRIRTPEGARKYGQPIGSTIRADVAPNVPKKVTGSRDQTMGGPAAPQLEDETPSPREAQDAAAVLGDSEVDRLTDGAGLSGATPAQLRRLVAAANRRREGKSTDQWAQYKDLEAECDDCIDDDDCPDCWQRKHTVWDGEEKVRRIRTPEGARKYGEPIGTIIRPDMVPGKPKTSKPKTPKKPPSLSDRLTRNVNRMNRRRDESTATLGRAVEKGKAGKGRKLGQLTAAERQANFDLNPDHAEGLTKVGPPDLITDDPDEALVALAAGKRVELRQPRQVSSLLNRLNEIVTDAKKKDKAAKRKWVDAGRDEDLYGLAQSAKANPDDPEKMQKFLDAGGTEADLDLVETIPDYNLCAITVKGTNLFCVEHKDMTRLTMPQLAGKPKKGSKAEAIMIEQNEERRRAWVASGKDPAAWEKASVEDGGPSNEANLAGHYRDHLRSLGLTTTQKKERASFLKASQKELVGANVAGMAASIENTNPDGTPIDPEKRFMGPGRIFVSEDNYILDGHHRWAAVVGVDLADNIEGDLDMDVEVVNAPILYLLPLTTAWTTEMGVPPKGGGKGSGGETVAAQEGRKMGTEFDTKDDDTLAALGPDAELAALLTGNDPDALDVLTEDEWGQILDEIHGTDLAAVKSINDAVDTLDDVDDMTAGEYRAVHLLHWSDQLDAKIGLSDTELEAIIEGLESKARRDHSSATHRGLDRSPKENWVDKAGGLPSYIERIAKHLHADRGMTISHAIAAAINRVKKWAAGGGGVSAATRAKAAKAVAQWEKMKAKTRAKRNTKTAPPVTFATTSATYNVAAPVTTSHTWVAPWTKAVDELTELDIAEIETLLGEWDEKRQFSDRERSKLAEEGAAMPGGRYPIRTRQDLLNAIKAYGRGAPADKPAIMRHIKKRAKALGLTDLLPDGWKSADEDIEEKTNVPNAPNAPNAGNPNAPGDMEGTSGPDPNEGGQMSPGLSAPGAEEEGTGDKAEGTDTSQGEAVAEDADDDSGDDEAKAGRMLSVSNASAIRSALTQLVSVLNRAGIAWGEDDGEGAPATKARTPSPSGYPWGEESDTRRRRGPAQLDEDEEEGEDEEDEEEDEGEGVPASSGASEDADAEDAEDADEEDADEEEEEEDDKKGRGTKVYLPLEELMEAAELRLTADV